MTAKKLRLIFGIPFFALLAVYCMAGFYFWLYPPGSDPGWREYEPYPGEFYIDRTGAQSPAKGLRSGDRIIAINGKNLAEHPGAIGDNYRMPPGSPYSMTVRRNGQELTFTWQTVPRRVDFPSKRLIALLFWLTGLLVLSLKAEDRQAWLLALMLGSSSSILGGGWPTAMPADWLTLLIALARIGGWFLFPLLLHLFLYFPHPSPLLRRWPLLTKWLYAPHFLLVLPTFGVSNLPAEWNIPIFNWPSMRWLIEHGLESIAWLSLLAYLLAALACLWRGYRMADVVGRRRLRVVMWGSLLGFGSVFLIVVMLATGTQEKLKTTWEWLQFSTLFTYPLLPLSFAYAIVRHRVIPISLILRRGVRYLLVSRGSILLSLLFAGLIVTAALSLLFKYLRPSALTIGLVSAAEGIAAWQAARWLHRRYLAPVIDRRFFRQSYDSQQIVAELADSLRTTTGIPHLLESVAKTLQSALQTESVTIFLRDEQTGDYRCDYGCVYDAADGRALKRDCASRLPRYAATLAQLAQTGEPLELDGGDPSFHLVPLTEANGHTLFTAEERQTLLELKTAMLAPLKAKDAMPGVVALGARLGDLPFSGEDKRLLQSVGASASLALENAQLVEGMIEEARRRQEIEAENEQRAKELEEARQLQLSMLPKRMPQLPQVEIAAVMKTATEVGGDYYDFHVGADGTLTIAIGDATGHGLKAGTVVAATKVLFNHLAGQPDLVATLDQASRALKQMNMRSLFMALTLVKLKGDRLQCGVAGMPPILIYRAATRTIEEVPLRGAPLGGLSSYDYRRSELTLALNDTLLLLSDGLPERFNAAGAMFGYEAIKELLLAHASAPLQMIVERLLQAGDEWAAGNPAGDDMTFVALRRKAAGGS
jgi:sigma-B regulation protein RsbU (phosphoserine phosphatase)